MKNEMNSQGNQDKAECNCCHRRSVNIVKEYGMCVECLCSEEFSLPKFTKRQREFVIANVNTLLGALAIFCIYKLTGDSSNQIASSIIVWFTYFTFSSILIIYIYNQLKKNYGRAKKNDKQIK